MDWLLWVLVAGMLSGVVSYRLWRIVAVDSITEPIRHKLFAGSTVPAVQWLDEMIGCAWCLGFWVNVVLAFALADTWQSVAAVALVGSVVTGKLAARD